MNLSIDSKVSTYFSKFDFTSVASQVYRSALLYYITPFPIEYKYLCSISKTDVYVPAYDYTNVIFHLNLA